MHHDRLQCIASNNPSDYQEARWSYPGFSDSQVNTSAAPENGTEQGVQYRIWTIEINTTAADAGKKWATCEFQQGDFPLSTDFQFLIFRKLSEEQNFVIYDFGEVLDEKDVTQKIENRIKKQISEHYSRPVSSFTISNDRQKINITFERSTTKSDAATSFTSIKYLLDVNNCPVILIPTMLTSNCQREKNTGGEPCSDGNTYYPHPTNCQKYYYCIHGKAREETCHSGLLYNEKLRFCDGEVNYVNHLVSGYSFLGRELQRKIRTIVKGRVLSQLRLALEKFLAAKKQL